MASIHKKALDRVNESGYNRSGIFDMLVGEADLDEGDTIQVCLGFLEPEDTVEIGEYIPEVWLVLRKVCE